MTIRVYGGRGSFPKPLSPDAIRSKISAVVERIRPADLVSPESRERFLAGLPEWLFGTVGGNTACIEVELERGQIIFDAGTGIVELGQREMKRSPRRQAYHIFFTHFHYDHVQGFPFFVPAFDPNVQLHFYSPIMSPKEVLVQQMSKPLFPILIDEKMTPHMHSHRLNGSRVELYGAEISWRELNHPGRAFAYRVETDSGVFCYCTDVELMETDFHHTDANDRFFRNIDALILDTQYTLGEAIDKYSWGHSSFSLGVDFAVTWKAKRLYLFHHEPQYNDKKMHHNLLSARSYADRIGGSDLEIQIAAEGMTIEV